jgi:pimeloyl-ACP methyl ester carboxylesterase
MLTFDRQFSVTTDDNTAPVTIAVTVYSPKNGAARSEIIYFCVPGGGLNRHYFNLLASDGQEQYSFARAATDRGATVVAVDSAGTGESGAPLDAFILHPERVAAYNSSALTQILTEAYAGALHPEMPALPPTTSVIGLGHSIGALFLTLQQASYGQFHALALLGFSQIGMPQALPDGAELLCDDPAARYKVERLARKAHDSAWIELPRGQGAGEIYGGGAAPAAMAGLKQCNTRLLATASLAVLIPRLYMPEFERITVPILSALGDRDICGTASDIATSFPNASSHEIHSLAATGHTHFVFASAPTLFEKVLSWGTATDNSLKQTGVRV